MTSASFASPASQLAPSIGYGKYLSACGFASFVVLPVVITEPGEYLTRCGERVTVEASSQRHEFGCKGFYGSADSKIAESWHRSGRLLFGRETQNDIVSRA